MEVQSMNMQTGQPQVAPVQVLQEAEVQRPKAAKAVAPAFQEQAESSRTQADEDADREDLPKVIKGINTVLANSGSHIRFVEHQASQRLMVQILDNNTNEVIRTIPSKELLDLAAKIGEMIGVLVDRKT